jgi:hypothetical protein
LQKVSNIIESDEKKGSMEGAWYIEHLRKNAEQNSKKLLLEKGNQEDKVARQSKRKLEFKKFENDLILCFFAGAYFPKNREV